MPYTIVWDADGVLFNTFDKSGEFQWSKTIVEDLKIDAMVLAHIFSADWSNVLRGTRDTRAHISEALLVCNSPISADEFIDYWLEKDSNVNLEIASHLNPASACIGTNQDRLRIKRISGLFAGRVRKIFASSDCGYLKQEAGFFRFVERELNLSADELCLIDDTLQNVETARSSGWAAHHFTGGETLKHFLAAHS